MSGKAMGRPTSPVVLTEQERAELRRWAQSRQGPQSLGLRARVLLACAEGLEGSEVARRLGTTDQTVCKWRQRFLRERLAGLADAPRSGAPRSISDTTVAEVVRLTLETKPAQATHWSTRAMAARCGLSHDSVHRIWQAFGLQPHRVRGFEFSKDPFFVEKVRDVVGLYVSPPANALVLCVDEKSQIQALERTQPVLPLRPGQPERQTPDYYRHGTTTLFAALEVATGRVIGQCQPRHTQRQFLGFLRTLDRLVPPGQAIHAVLDNYATHKTPAVKRWLARHPRWHLHFIPTRSSWLNQIERWFARITHERLRRGVFQSVPQLVAAIGAYIAEHNRQPRPFVWTASADLILGKVSHLLNQLR